MTAEKLKMKAFKMQMRIDAMPEGEAADLLTVEQNNVVADWERLTGKMFPWFAEYPEWARRTNPPTWTGRSNKETDMDKVIKMYRAAIEDYIRIGREKQAACIEAELTIDACSWGNRASAYEAALRELDTCIKIYGEEETK